MKNNTLYTNIKVESLENAEVKITGEIPVEVVEQHRPHVIKALQKDFEVPGFRKGHVPEKMIVEKIGEPAILNEIAEHALQEAYPAIVTEQKLNVIGRPAVSLTKLAPSNPIGFSIQTAVLPDITLPDYKKIAADVMKETDDVVVTDEDVNAVIEQIQKSQTPPSQESDGEKKEETKPELTDDFVRTLGEFKDVADFKQKLRENIKIEKERKAKEAKRVEMGEKIIEGATLAVPRILIDSELEKMLAQFKGDIERMGLKFDDYLTRLKKTEADIRNELEADAKKRAQLQLVLNKIAADETVAPEKDAIEREVEHLVSHIKDAEPERVRIYVETMLTNEEVFRFLESQGHTEEPAEATKSE